MPNVQLEVADLVLSTARIYVNDDWVNAELPADTVANGADWGGDWWRLGLTNAPATFAYAYDVTEANVQESLAVVDRAKSSESLVIETTLGQLDPDVHVLTWDGSSETVVAAAGVAGKKIFKVGGSNKLRKYAVGIEGDYADDDDNVFPIRFLIYVATFALGGTLEFQKAAFTGTTMRLSALGDMRKAIGAQLFEYQKWTAEPTS